MQGFHLLVTSSIETQNQSATFVFFGYSLRDLKFCEVNIFAGVDWLYRIFDITGGAMSTWSSSCTGEARY